MPECNPTDVPSQERNAADVAAPPADGLTLDYDQRRAEYIEERQLLIKAQNSAIENFDKTLVVFSGVTLGFSINFSKTLGNIAQDSWLLMTAWALLVMAVCSSLMSLYASYRAYQEALDDHDKAYEQDTPAADDGPWGRWTDHLNKVTLGCFLLGLGSFIVFASLNHFR